MVGRRGFLKMLGLGGAAILTVRELPEFKGYKSDLDELTINANRLHFHDYAEKIAKGIRYLPPRDILKEGYPDNPEEGNAFCARDEDLDDEIGGDIIIWDGEQWCKLGGSGEV